MKNALPRILSRSEHTISRRLLNPNAVKALYRLNDNGFTAYLVGGCVRDLLLGREPKDFDIATSATPNQVKRLFRNCRLVGRRFRLAHLHFNDGIIEVATFRANAAEAAAEDEDEAAAPLENHRQPQVLRDEEGMILRDNLFGSPEEDAWRRDFTVNALCYNIADFSLIDHIGGLDDLQRGVIRTIGDPWQRFTEDPVRMIRAIRFAAILGFTIEENSWQALVELAPTIGRAAPARLYEELLKLFLSGEGERTYQLLRNCGLFTYLLPPLATWLSAEHEGFPHVWLGKALEWADRQVAEGVTISFSLLMTLLFGQYLAEEAERLRGRKESLQPAMDRATATLLEELAPVVLVPNRIVVQMRDILACSHRLRTIPGRRAQAVVARPNFSDTLQYLRFRSSVEPEDDRIVSWWERLAATEPVPTPSHAAPTTDDQPRRRRRPRRRRKPHAPVISAPEGGLSHEHPPPGR